MLRSVWSFWTKPWRSRAGWRWSSEKHHLLAWILSFENARRHYPETSLVTDDLGAQLLVERLKLPFERVSTELNALAECDPTVWMLGKLYAYRAQTEPFVHLDTDTFLWKRLPAEVESAPVFAQNPDPFRLGDSHHKVAEVVRLLRHQTHGWIPQEWEWALSLGDAQRSECCGIMGANHLPFIRYYAQSAIQLLEDPRNAAGWSSVANKFEYLTTVEEYHLAACIDFHRAHPTSAYHEVEIRYLFDSFPQAFDPNVAARVAFTHLLTSAKNSPAIGDRMEKRVQRDYPERYRQCLRAVASELVCA
jgi:hypothetical protein